MKLNSSTVLLEWCTYLHSTTEDWTARWQFRLSSTLISFFVCVFQIHHHCLTVVSFFLISKHSLFLSSSVSSLSSHSSIWLSNLLCHFHSFALIPLSVSSHHPISLTPARSSLSHHIYSVWHAYVRQLVVKSITIALHRLYLA